MNNWLIIIFISIIFSNPNLHFKDHALYIGVLQLDHQPNQSNARLAVKVFTDDLQNALRNHTSDYTPSAEETCCQINRSGIEHYFQKHITGKINGKSFHLSLSKCQKENEVYFIEFDMSCAEEWNSLEISAAFFMELFPTQANMIQVINGAEKRFFKMTIGTPFFKAFF